MSPDGVALVPVVVVGVVVGVAVGVFVGVVVVMMRGTGGSGADIIVVIMESMESCFVFRPLDLAKWKFPSVVVAVTWLLLDQ